MSCFSPRSRERGFTLMEMLVVLVIIGLIAMVAVPQVMKLLESARHKAVRIQVETVGQSLSHYSLDMDGFPTKEQGLGALLKAPSNDANWDGPYVRGPEQLKDPWGHPLIYLAPSKATGGKFILKSLGADGVEGGAGDDRDVEYHN